MVRLRLVGKVLGGAGVFVASALVSALFSHSLTPVYRSSAAESDVSVTIEPSVALAILAQDPNTGGASSTAIDTIAMDVLPDGAGGGSHLINRMFMLAPTTPRAIASQ